MKFTIYQETRTGKRANNEDRLAHCYSRDSLLMVVADGMGGHYFGEVAAQIAVQTLSESFQRQGTTRIRDPFLFLQTGMLSAHSAILDFAGTHHLEDSPRTTCVACLVQNNVAYWAHVGDSRLYHLRKGRVLAQTRDHSRVRLLLDQGVITEAEALNHPDKNKVYSCLGGTQMPEIEFSRKTPLEAGDVLIACTDGVWGVIDGERIAKALNGANLMVAVPMLMNQAEIESGPHGDNLSAVVIRWEDNYVEATESTISTHTMAFDEVTTKMQEFGRDGQHKVDLTDDEIEKAIAEIRNTIQKYSK